MTISAESHEIVMHAAAKCFWTCRSDKIHVVEAVQTMLRNEVTRRFSTLQAMGVIHPRAHMSRRIAR
jgi:hypothetical protein